MKTYILSLSAGGNFKPVMLAIVGCLTGLTTCPAVALIYYVLMKAKHQSSTAG